MRWWIFNVSIDRQLVKDSPGRLGKCCGLCGGSAPVLGVRVRFYKAEGLEKQDKDAGGEYTEFLK